MKELFAIVSKDGSDSIIRIQFQSCLKDTGSINSWLEGKLLAKGYEDVLVFHRIAPHFFKEEYCELIELE